MTRAARAPLPTVPDQQAAVVKRTVRSGHGMGLAGGADGAALDHFAGRLFAEDLGSNTYVFSYTRSPNARFLVLEWWVPGIAGLGSVGTAAVTLDITDGTNTILHTSSKIPLGFKGEVAQIFGGPSLQDRFAGAAPQFAGTLDLTACHALLPASDDWTLMFTVAVTGAGYVGRLLAWEPPRFVADDTETDAILLTGFFPASPVTDGAVDGLERLRAVAEAARTGVPQTYVALVFPETTDPAQTPSTSAIVDGPVTLLDEAGAAPMLFRVRVRQLAAPSHTPGEGCRFRVLYRMTSAGPANETAIVKLRTGSSASPFSTAVLAYTTAWTWSPWIAGQVAADAADATDLLSVTAAVSAATGTLWLAALQVVDVQPA